MEFALPAAARAAPLAVIALLALQTPAFAQTAEEPVTTLGTVVIKASRSNTLLQEMPLHTTVITQEDIQNSPAQTLDQLLRHVPGLLVSGAPAYVTDPTGQNIKFRGMDKKVLVLVDGMPVLDPFYGTIQWFKVPLSSVERVEIVRGGGSSLWGNLAVGGVINIVSKRPTGNDGEASISFGSRNTWSAAVSKNFVLSDTLSVNLAVDGFRSNGYNTASNDLTPAFWPGRGSSSAHSENLRLSAFFRPSPDFNAFVRVGYHEQTEDIGGYAFGSNVQRSPDLQSGLTKVLDGASRLTANFYTQYVDFDKFNGAGCYAAASFACGAPVSGNGASAAQQAAPTLQYALSRDLNTYREHGGSLVYTRLLEGLVSELQIGLDYRAIGGEDAQQTYRTPTPALPDALRVRRSNFGAGEQQFLGLFSQLKMRPLDRLDITFGARVDTYRSTNGSALQSNYSDTATPVAAASAGGPVPDSRKTAFDPSVSARYTLTEQLDLRGSVYKAFRAPGLNNLYRSFGSNAITIANPLLGPETLVGKELGIDWRGDHYSVSATLFQAQVKDVVATYSITPATPIPSAVQAICGPGYAGTPNAACPGSVSFYTNGQDQRSSGIELDGQWAIDRNLNLGAYATATRSTYTRTVTGDPTGVQLPLIPKYVAGAKLTWRAGERWTHDVETRYSSSTLLSGLMNSPPLVQGAYAVLNLNTTYRVNKNLDVLASVGNVFDRRYSDGGANSPQNIMYGMPRTVTLGMRARF